jgi:hypothetical protein
MIHSEGYILIGLHLTQIVRIVLSDNISKWIMECVICAAVWLENCVYSLMQMISHVSKYVSKCFCFAFKTESVLIL